MTSLTRLEPGAKFDLLRIKNFFDARACASLVALMRAAGARPASVYGVGQSARVDERVRRAARVEPSAEAAALVMRALLGRAGEIGAHFGVALSGCEEPQFLRYGVGDFFVAHQDGNTGLLRSEREQSRKVSAVVFLNDQTESARPGGYYCGGSLAFHRWGVGAGSRDLHEEVRGEAGSLVVFRPETTHEVLPVTRGERYTIACWYV
jgi:SM-20-related protein